MPSAEFDASFFDHEHNLVNFSNSLLAHFGAPTFHPTLAAADAALKGHKKVAVFLYDGMGELILKMHEKRFSYLLSHQIASIYSTNPATTVAATDALLSGRYPIETGWLGWSQYFPDLGRPLDVFKNRDSSTGEVLKGPNIMLERCPYDNIAKQMADRGVKAKASFEYGIGGDKSGPRSLSMMNRQARAFFANGGQFLYSYWTKPDMFLHAFGTKSLFVKEYIASIQRHVKAFAKKNPDVLLFVIADHGLIDVHYEDISLSDPALAALLEGPIVLEGRTPSFFVKKGKEAEFEKRFADHYGPRAHLMKTEDALKEGYFGEGKAHPLTRSFLGDYVAVMLDETVLFDSRSKKIERFHKGHHAGGLPKERLISLSCYNR